MVDGDGWKDTVWCALGVSEVESARLIRVVRAAIVLEETRTGSLERLFPRMDPRELALVYAYAQVFSEEGVGGLSPADVFGRVVGSAIFSAVMSGEQKKGDEKVEKKRLVKKGKR